MNKQQSGVTHPPGSPEDLKLAFENLQRFFTAKLKAIELHGKGLPAAEGTATKSVCHIDGTDDGDE